MLRLIFSAILLASSIFPIQSGNSAEPSQECAGEIVFTGLACTQWRDIDTILKSDNPDALLARYSLACRYWNGSKTCSGCGFFTKQRATVLPQSANMFLERSNNHYWAEVPVVFNAMNQDYVPLFVSKLDATCRPR